MRKILLGLGLFVALFLSACSSNEKDTLRVATNANFPPYEYIENGDYVGIDIEIAKQIAKELNLKLDIQNMPFDSIIAGKIDCVIIDEQPAKSFVASNRGLEILATEYVEEEYAIIVSKEKEELLKKINSIISKLKSDGTIAAIQKKYIK